MVIETGTTPDNSHVLETAQPVRCTVEVWDPFRNEEAVDADIQEISRIDIDAFGEKIGWQYTNVREYFLNIGAVAVVLRDPQTKKIAGYTIALPSTLIYCSRIYKKRRAATNIAYIANTAIDKAYRGHHYTPEMMAMLEEQLRDRGYEFIDRDADDTPSSEGKPSYADNIVKNEADRIDTQYQWKTPIGPQRYIRMRIKEQN